jgi:S-adenosylmethionine decarboxylase
MFNQKQPSGLHVLGKIYTEAVELLMDSFIIRKKISKIIKKNGLKDLHSFYYQFPKNGFTGIICLYESHIALHTWPEFNCVTLDVFICNYSCDNTQACRDVFDQIINLFKPNKIIRIEKKR